MAHRCLAVDEIVRAIAAILVTENRIGSAVALASCSKSLEEPALAEVWRSLNHFEPLVKCFPPDVWEVVGKERSLSFKRSPLQAEWTRFQKQYASKVQYLSAPYSDSSAALLLLQLYADGPLLPNLVSLTWSTIEKPLPFIFSFLSPSLMSITINLRHMATPLLPPILNKLSTLSPDNHLLSKIKITLALHDPSVEEATSRLLMHCNHRLRVFDVSSPISSSGLSHVMQLPSLEEFRLVVHSFQLPVPLPTIVFPSLRSLYVNCSGVRDLSWLKLLAAIENPVLANITVTCPGLDVEWFMETFELTSTGITGRGMRECLQQFTVISPDDFKITPQIIAHSSSFKNLTRLELFPECSDVCQTSDLTDSDIDLLTKSMVFLEILSIGGDPCGIPSQITFKSLYTISSRCRQLRDLQIHFNPALFVTKVGTELEPWVVALGLSDPKTLSSDLCYVTEISVGRIPLPAHHSASCVMAFALMKMFPCLQEIYYENEDWSKVVDLKNVLGCFAD